MLGYNQEKKSLTHIHREILKCATSEGSLGKEGAPPLLGRDFPALCHRLSKQTHLPLPVPCQSVPPPASWPLSSKSWRSFHVRRMYTFPSVLWFCSVPLASSITCPLLGVNPFSTQFKQITLLGLSRSFLPLRLLHEADGEWLLWWVIGRSTKEVPQAQQLPSSSREWGCPLGRCVFFWSPCHSVSSSSGPTERPVPPVWPLLTSGVRDQQINPALQPDLY